MERKALRDADKDMKARDVIAKWASDSGYKFGSETLRLLAGNDIDDFEDIRPLISGYAAANGHELVAEAFVDVCKEVVQLPEVVAAINNPEENSKDVAIDVDGVSLPVRISWTGSIGNRRITSFFPVDPNRKERR